MKPLTASFPRSGCKRLLSLVLPVLLAACGGGGDEFVPPRVTETTAKSASENAAVIPSDSTQAMTVSLSRSRGLVLGLAVTCDLGGTAAFTVSGGIPVPGQFVAGVEYRIEFDNCRSSSDNSTLNGKLSLKVNNASGENYTVEALTDNLEVKLPQRTTRLNGSSTVTHSVSGSGGNTTTIDHWVTPSYTVVTTSNGRTSSFSLSSVDLTRTVVAVNGAQTSRKTQGSATLSANLPKASFTITWTSGDAIQYDANGVPLIGTWSLVLGHTAIKLVIVGEWATITFNDGFIPPFKVSELINDAG